MTEAQMIKAMTRALSRLLAAIDAVEWRDKANLRLGPVVPEYENARAALDAIREHVMPSAALIERLTAERDAALAALEPFRTFGASEDGAPDLLHGLMRDRICDWFGVSDFERVRALPLPAHQSTGDEK